MSHSVIQIQELWRMISSDINATTMEKSIVINIVDEIPQNIHSNAIVMKQFMQFLNFPIER